MGQSERNRNRLSSVNHAQPFRLFSGIAFCGHCGKKLQGSFHTSSPGNRCLGTEASAEGSHVYVSTASLEELLVAELGRIAISEELITQIEDRIEVLIRNQDDALRSQLVKLRTGLQENREKTGRIVEAIGNGVLPNSVARSQIRLLEEEALHFTQEELAIEARLASISNRADQIRSAKQALHKFTEVWNHLTDSERREALHVSIEKLEVFAQEERKWIAVKFVFNEEPVEIEVLRGAERFRSGKLDGEATLTARELAALKHVLDGANYVQIAKYFESSPRNAHALLRRACQMLSVKKPLDAAQRVEPHIRRVASQLPLFGKASLVKHTKETLDDGVSDFALSRRRCQRKRSAYTLGS